MLRHYRLVRLVLIVAVSVFIISAFYLISFPLAGLARDFFFGPVNIFSVVLSQPVLQSDDGRTNILLLGTGGAKHDGPNLTDTIIVASMITQPDEGQNPLPISLISLPRDIYLDSLEGKINTAYEVGLEKDAGLTLAKGAAGFVTGLPIHYAVRVDFSVFEKIIDLLDGIEITVPRAFDDYEYPVDGRENDDCGGDPTFACRFEHLYFDAGVQTMDGKTALKFIRSRKAQGEEGTDFARARRQQLVIGALKDKILSTQTFRDFKRVQAIYEELKTHIDTDLTNREIASAFNLGLKYRNATIKSIILDLNLLDNPPEDYRGWILLPKSGNWDEVHQFIKKELEN